MIRVDLYLVQNGFVSGRDAAKRLIAEGGVTLDGKTVVRPSEQVDETVSHSVRLPEGGQGYASRGGLKLEKAMEVFPVKLDGKICMDIGASTGGFTDCMLQNGAVKVYAVDVGYGQLAWKLRSDERVVCMEKTNFRYVTKEQIPEDIDFASVDVSFISLSKILPAAYPLLKEDGEMVCLIKPQFEAGKENVGKKGVVRDPEIHISVIESVFGYATENGFYVRGLDYSPVRGPEGNIEYLMHISKTEDAQAKLPGIKDVVAGAHATL